MRLSIFNFSRLKGLGAIPLPVWLWFAVIVIAGAVVYVKCVGVITDFNHRRSNPHILAREALGKDTQIIALSSSHGLAAINPTYIDTPMVNLSLNSGNYEVLDVLLRSHIDALPNLKYVLLELDNTCLALDRLSGTRDFRTIYDLGGQVEHFPKSTWWKVNQRVLDHELVKPVVFYARITPYELIYIRKKFYSAEKYQQITRRPADIDDGIPVNRHQPGQRAPGHRAQLIKMDREQLDEIAKIQLKPDLVTESRISRNADAFERMIQLLIERDIQPVFIRFPYTYAYNRWGTDEWKAIEKEFEAFVRELFGEHFMLWELPSEPDFELDDFADSQHLNKWGAIKFSRLLDEKLATLPGLE